MTLRMLTDYVLVELKDADTISSGGIAIVKAEQPCTGTVISAGPGKYDTKGNFIEVPLKGGETVIFGKSSLNQELMHEGTKYHVMRYDEIFAVEL